MTSLGIKFFQQLHFFNLDEVFTFFNSNYELN